MIWVCPPETARHKNGNSGTFVVSFSSCANKAMICPFVWFTSINGMSIDKAKAFENEVPTKSEPKSPGPRVKAIADN